MDVRITYESLFDLLRRERTREELQQLDSNFYESVVAYLQSKAEGMKSEDEAEKIQIRNIKKIIKELYERREKKIINIAIDKSRSPTNIIDVSVLLPEEKQLFDELGVLITKYKNSILGNVIELKMPDLKTAKEETKPRKPGEDEYIMVRFLHPLPKFVGKKNEILGPYDEEEIAKLPRYIADLLIRKERAEAINT